MGERAPRAHVLAPGGPGGPLVVLAHGLEDGWTGWRAVAAHWPAGARLVALDLPWRAGNDYRWRQRDPGWWLAEGLAPLGAVPDLLVGHSFGANAALELLCAATEPPRAAALLCPLYRVPGAPLGEHAEGRSRAAFARLFREGVLARLGERAASMEEELRDRVVALAAGQVGAPGFRAAFDQYHASAALPLGRVTTPTLVLGGGANPTLSRTEAAALADGMPGGSLVFHDTYDHFCHIRRAHDVVAQLVRLVEPAPAAPRDGGPR
uniref:Alpha/beta hydrolase n=1 Tax=Streptoalloteichus sp. ATCC 53650 TaxID=756733 RepID=K4NYV3_9PSEU|nr:hypothetical protein [Streptoalloteichus sp. ATCC 53650]